MTCSQDTVRAEQYLIKQKAKDKRCIENGDDVVRSNEHLKQSAPFNPYIVSRAPIQAQHKEDMYKMKSMKMARSAEDANNAQQSRKK